MSDEFLEVKDKTSKRKTGRSDTGQIKISVDRIAIAVGIMNTDSEHRDILGGVEFATS